MRAVVLRKHGGPETLELADIARPEISGDQVLVRVAACGLNHLDLWTRRGLPGREIAFPHVLGNEPVGTVEELGPEARGVKVGDRVVVAPGYLDRFHANRSGWDASFPDYRVRGHQSAGGGSSMPASCWLSRASCCSVSSVFIMPEPVMS